MKNWIITLLCLLALTINFPAWGVVPPSVRPPANPLIQFLPALDGVALIDGKRFFSTALPKLLSANPTMLAKVNDSLEEMKTNSGVDIRRFEQIAVGFTARNNGPKDYDLDAIVIGRGSANSLAVIEAAKLAANGRYREEKLGDRTIYLFSPKAIISQVQKQVPARTGTTADKIVSKAPKEIAVTVLDDSTIAFGDLALVRLAVSPQRTTVSAELTDLLSKNGSAVFDFAARVPRGLGAYLPLENDELGKSIDSIRFLYGGADLIGETAKLNVTARTLKDQHAASLLETLEGLQMLGKALLGNAQGRDKQAFARMIENAKFTASGNEVMLDLQVPQSDVDILVGKLR